MKIFYVKNVCVCEYEHIAFYLIQTIQPRAQEEKFVVQGIIVILAVSNLKEFLLFMEAQHSK